MRAEFVAADLTDESSRTRIKDELDGRGLGVNILVEQRRGSPPSGPVYRSDPAREVAMVRTDVEAVVHLCSLFLPEMAERRSGASAQRGVDRGVPAAPRPGGLRRGKAFVLSYSHALRGELRPVGVTVTALCPGPVSTGFQPPPECRTRFDEALPRFMWVPARDVAKAAVAGMDANRAVVIPGVANRVTAAAAWMSPRSVLVPAVAKRHPALRI